MTSSYTKSKFSHLKKSAIATALLATLLPFSNTQVHAGIMITDYDLQLYGDIAEGRGIFAPGQTNIKVYDKNGKLRGELPSGVDVQGVGDKYYETIIAPQFGLSATHVGYTSTVTFGNLKTFIYNDGTLFEGSGTAKPFDGSTVTNTTEWKRILYNATEMKKWSDLFLKYLGTTYQEANPDAMPWSKNDANTDFKIDRYTKLVVEAIPYELMDDNSRMKVGDRVLHVGAGSSKYLDRATGKYTDLSYATPIGGTGILIQVSDASAKLSAANPDSTEPDRILPGTSFRFQVSNPAKPNDILEQMILGGDSGSPVFWLDPNDNKWKLAGVTSAITGYAFGNHSIYIGNTQWTVERMKFYQAPTTQLEEGERIVIHGQNGYNGRGNLHIVKEGIADIIDDKLSEDIQRVKGYHDIEVENSAYILQQTIAYNNALDKYNKDVKVDKTLVKPKKEDYVTNKPGLTLPTEEQMSNSSYADQDGIRYQEYKGFTHNYNFDGLGDSKTKLIADEKVYKTYALHRKEKNLTFSGAGVGKQHTITFSEDVSLSASKNVVDLGADTITIKNGDFILKQDEAVAKDKQVTSFINAGYIIEKDASLSYQLAGEAKDAIHKLGQGTLKIEGTGNQLSPLNVGDGIIELNRTNGTATPYLKIASGRAVVRLMQDNQLVRDFDKKANNVAVGFGQNGGVLDFNGHDKNQTWIDIYHLDKGATIANLAEGAENKVTFTFNPNGKRSYFGSFVGNLDIVYNPSKTNTTDNATWWLKNTVDTTGDFKLASKANLVLGDVLTNRGWGQFFDDRYDRVTFISGTTTMEEGSTLNVGRNTIFASDVTAKANTSINIHNLKKLIAAENPYKIDNQAQVEKTVVAGSITLEPTAKAIVDVEQEHVIDLFSSVRGQGTLTLTGKGLINLGGNNDFTGTIKICETNSNAADCTTQLTFENKLGADYAYDPLTKPELPEVLQPEVTTATPESSSTESATTTPAPADQSSPVIAAPEVSTTPALAALSTNLQPITLASVDYSGFESADLVVNDSTNVNISSEPVIPPSVNQPNSTASSSVDSSSNATSASKPQIDHFEYDAHEKWAGNQLEATDQAEKNYTHNPQDQKLQFIPAPAADSLVLNFFSKNAVFHNASLVDSTNAKVVFYTNFADVQSNETLTWDFSNYQGDAFIVKDGDYTLQIKNHNLSGTFFLRAGSLVTDQIGSHLVVGQGATLYADARGAAHHAILQGRVYNAGTIYLTQKTELLPTTMWESNKLTVTPPTITIAEDPAPTTPTSPESTPTTPTPASPETATTENFASSTLSSNLTLASGADILASGTSTTTMGNTMDGNMLITGADDNARRNLAVLEIKGDYVGNNGRFVYDLTENAYQVQVDGNVSGKTTLDVKDIEAVTASGRESFDVFMANGNIQENSIQLAGGYVSGGVYDYIAKYAGNSIRLVNYIDTNNVDVVPNTSFGDDAPPTTEPLPEWDPIKNPITSVSDQEPPITEALPEWDPIKNPITSVGDQPAPTVPELPTAGIRLINSSVGTLLANRRFMSNFNINPLDLTQRSGFYLNVDRDSEELEFQGAKYSSRYTAQRTLVGNNFQVGAHSSVGIFATTGKATSEIYNYVNTATGQVQAYGLGLTSGTQVGNFELAGSVQYLYLDNRVTGTHEQHETLHGGWAATQVAYTLPMIGDATNHITIKPYVLLQAEFTPTSHFVSRLGEELGTVTAHRYTQATGIKMNAQLSKFSLEVDAYKNLGQRTTEFNSYYTKDNIRALNNNYRVKTTLAYQLLPSVKVSTYFNTQGSHKTTGMALDVKW